MRPWYDYEYPHGVDPDPNEKWAYLFAIILFAAGIALWAIKHL